MLPLPLHTRVTLGRHDLLAETPNPPNRYMAALVREIALGHVDRRFNHRFLCVNVRPPTHAGLALPLVVVWLGRAYRGEHVEPFAHRSVLGGGDDEVGVCFTVAAEVWGVDCGGDEEVYCCGLGGGWVCGVDCVAAFVDGVDWFGNGLVEVGEVGGEVGEVVGEGAAHREWYGEYCSAVFVVKDVQEKDACLLVEEWRRKKAGRERGLNIFSSEEISRAIAGQRCLVQLDLRQA